jgi:hypothetical protein
MGSKLLLMKYPPPPPHILHKGGVGAGGRQCIVIHCQLLPVRPVSSGLQWQSRGWCEVALVVALALALSLALFLVLRLFVSNKNEMTKKKKYLQPKRHHDNISWAPFSPCISPHYSQFPPCKQWLIVAGVGAMGGGW